MSGSDSLIEILEEMRAGLVANDKGSVTVEPTPVVTPPLEPPELEDPPWLDEEKLPPETDADLIPFKNPRKELVFMPLAVSSSWVARQGSPESHVRKFRSTTVVSSQGYTPAGRPVGLCSGLISRRVLLSLVTRATMEKSPVISVPSIKDLLAWAGLGLAGQSHKSCQRNLFQMALMSVDLWFQPTERNATIFKGGIFDRMDVTIERGEQQQFSFIPNEVVFSQDFYSTIIENKAVPYLRDEVMKATSAYEHDLLMWLFQRQSYDYLQKPVFLNYFLMREQFGTNQSEPIATFKYRFKKEIRKIVKKYGRRIDVKKDGIVLHPMPAMVPYKKSGKFRKW